MLLHLQLEARVLCPGLLQHGGRGLRGLLNGLPHSSHLALHGGSGVLGRRARVHALQHQGRRAVGREGEEGL